MNFHNKYGCLTNPNLLYSSINGYSPFLTQEKMATLNCPCVYHSPLCQSEGCFRRQTTSKKLKLDAGCARAKKHWRRWAPVMSTFRCGSSSVKQPKHSQRPVNEPWGGGKKNWFLIHDSYFLKWYPRVWQWSPTKYLTWTSEVCQRKHSQGSFRACLIEVESASPTKVL